MRIMNKSSQEYLAVTTWMFERVFVAMREGWPTEEANPWAK